MTRVEIRIQTDDFTWSEFFGPEAFLRDGPASEVEHVARYRDLVSHNPETVTAILHRADGGVQVMGRNLPR